METPKMRVTSLLKGSALWLTLVIICTLLIWKRFSNIEPVVDNYMSDWTIKQRTKGMGGSDWRDFEIPVDNYTLRPHELLVKDSCPKGFEVNTSELKYTIFSERAQVSPYTQQGPEVSHYTERILILTPIYNSGDALQRYFENLCSLTYPHRLISVAFGEDSSLDKTLHIAHQFAETFGKKYFRRVDVFHFQHALKMRSGSRHDAVLQLKRRAHLAAARNQLLSQGLQDESWVLWLDSDVRYIPPDLIQHLLSARKHVVAASCLYISREGTMDIYDRNSWQETQESLAFLERQSPGFLMLEGYAPSIRKYLPHMTEMLVPLDGVGGCALLVRADCHRKGLIFPTFVFGHHIETEGLSKMAKQMNFTVYGLPGVIVLHS